MEINITELPTNGNQSSSCENCAAYKENAERAYEAVQKFAQTRQEAINLQKVCNSVLRLKLIILIV